MTATPQPPDETDVLFYVLRRKRLHARLVMVYEALWPALWPPLGLIGTFCAIALLDLPVLLPPWLRIAMLTGFALAILYTLIRGLTRIALPTPAQADRRLERATGLRHRPLEILYDTPALPGADSLWRAHIARARAQITRLRVGLPRPGLAAIDRRALRALVLLAVLAALGVAGEQAPARLLRALQPGFTPPSVPTTPLLQAWITPPPYTGLAPVFLKPEGGAVSVPAGAHLTVNLSGGAARPDLLESGQTIPFQVLGEASFQADQDLTSSGPIIVRRNGADMAAWNITVIANVAPDVRFTDHPAAIGNPRQAQVRLPWEVSHAYGVTTLQAELRLTDRPDAPPLVIAIPLTGAPKQAKGARTQDLTPHPWAGLPVTALLVARDATGLTGTSETETLTLPERRFQNPIARALVAVRKNLTLRPDDRLPAMLELIRLAGIDDAWKDDLGAYLNLRAIESMIHRGRPDVIDEVQMRLWQLALHIEEGAPERTARALEQARKELREMLDAEKRGEQIDKAELERRMKEVQDALQRHLQALAEQAQRDPGNDKFDPKNQQMDTRNLEKLTEQLRDATREGRMDEAREKLAELDKMLDALEKGEKQRGKMTQKQRDRAEKRQRGEQQMSAVQDLVKREGGLLDHAQSRSDTGSTGDFRRPGFPSRPLFNQPDIPEDQRRATAEKQTQDRAGDLKMQQAMRRALGELMQQHGDLTGKIPPNLGEADGAMRDAGAALAQGRDAAAANAEQRAVEALQKGSKQMGEQMAQMMKGQGDEEGDDDGDDEGDGNQMGENGQDGDQPGDGQGQGPGFGNQYGNNQPGNRGRGNRPWGPRQGMDRRDGDKRDPLGRLMQDGTGGLDESGQTEVPEEMEQARTRAIQDELRRRGAERTRPKPELDYIDRLLRQF